MLFAATGLVSGLVAPALAADVTTAAPAPGSQVNLGIQLAQNSPTVGNSLEGVSVSKSANEQILVKAKRLILKEKNSPSAVTELGSAAIAATGVSGSPATLLRQAPSIYVYQQGIGDSAPELTVRGLRGLEIATTLDGIPTQDLLAPGSFYLANNIGGVFTLGQISGVSIYPGVAYPDKNTFGTIGGTIAYTTKRPTDDAYLDVVGSVGSFGTYKEGFEANSGSIDSPFGTGDNALKVLLNYYNLQTQGFIDGTPNRENEFEFAADKPYDDGLSDFQTTVIYNTANGLIQNEPVPVPYLQKNGFFSNYPTNLDFAQQQNADLTIILKDDTYVNDYLNVGLTAFYIANDQQLQDYGNINLDVPGGFPSPLGAGASSPFINNPAGFGEGNLFGPPVGGGGFGIYGGGTGGLFYGAQNSYNPLALYPPGSKYCPTSLVNQYKKFDANGGSSVVPCGLNDQITISHSDTYGIQPRATIILPEYFGIANTIKIGALIAKETSPAGTEYLGGAPNSFGAANQFGNPSGGTEREIYQGYIQDKIDLLENTLHITPGVTIEGTHSSIVGGDIFGSKLAPAYGPNGAFSGNGTATNIDAYGYFKATKWDREVLPFANVTYDLDKVFPALAGTSLYGSFGDSALFAPVGDFGPNTTGTPPNASIVHLYEGGVKYDTSKLLLSADYFYQKVDRDFGFFNYQSGPQAGQSFYNSNGAREFKGFEAAATWQATPDIQLFANASHLLAKYLVSSLQFVTVAEDQYGVGINGTPISGIPDWLSNFGIDYTHKSMFVDNDLLNVRFAGNYTGHQSTTYDLQGPSVFQVPFVQGVDYTNKNQVFNTFTGATTYDPNGGIAPFVTFNLDANYKLPTPTLPVLKSVTFDMNIQNLFNQHYYQYYYKQISPSACNITPSNPTGNNYGCTPQFADGIPGQPFSIFFTVTARF